MNQYSKHIVRADFAGMEKFPLDCETLAAMQNNTDLMAVLANIAADKDTKLILCGCKLEGNYRTEGYVWMRTEESPVTGEILYHPRTYATDSYGWQIKTVSDNPDFQETRPVTVDGIPYAKVYSLRYITDVMPGGGSWKEMTHIENVSNVALKELIAAETDGRKNADKQLEERIETECAALKAAIEGKSDQFRVVTKIFYEDASTITGETFEGKTILGCYLRTNGSLSWYFTHAVQIGNTLTLYGDSYREFVAKGLEPLQHALGMANPIARAIFTYIE